MTKFKFLASMAVMLFFFGCSLKPETKITMKSLIRSDVAYYVVEDEMEGVLTVLNRDGEVVLKANYFDKPVLVKIFATSNEGIIVQQFDPNTMEFID